MTSTSTGIATAGARTRRLSFIAVALVLGAAGRAAAADAEPPSKPWVDENTAAPAVSAAAPAPHLYGLALSLDVFGNHRYEPGYALVASSERQSSVGVSAAYDLVRVRERGTLAVGVGIVGEKDEQRTSLGGDLIAASLDRMDLYAQGAFRWALFRHVEPYLALAAGWTRAWLSLDPDQGASFADRSDGVFGRAGLGVRLVSALFSLGGLPGHDFALAAALEAGAAQGTHLSFALKPDKAPPADAIASEAVSLGSLGQRRTYARLQLTLLF